MTVWSSSSVGGPARRVTSGRWRPSSAELPQPGLPASDPFGEAGQPVLRPGHAVRLERGPRLSDLPGGPRDSGPEHRTTVDAMRISTRIFHQGGMAPDEYRAGWMGSGHRWVLPLRGNAPLRLRDRRPRRAPAIGNIESLAKLHAGGVLTDEEFAAAKRRIIDEVGVSRRRRSECGDVGAQAGSFPGDRGNRLVVGGLLRLGLMTWETRGDSQDAGKRADDADAGKHDEHAREAARGWSPGSSPRSRRS